MLKELIQTTEPKIYISVFDDYADCSDDETPMRYCSVQWVWQDSADNWAWLETTGIIEEPDDDGHIAIESIAYDFSDCTGGFSHEMTKEEEWEMPIHIPDGSGIDVLQIVRSVNVHLRGLAFDEVVYPLEAV